MARSRQPRRKLRVIRFALVLGVSVLIVGGTFGLHKVQMKRHAGGFAERGRAAVKVQDWPIAASMFRNYLKFQPDDAEVLKEFADSLEELRKQAPEKILELIEVLERLRKIDALTLEDRRKLAQYYAKIGNTAASRSTMDDLIANAGKEPDVELLELTAGLDEAERKIPQAIATYRKVIATGKATPESYIRLANLLRKEQESDAEAETVIADLVRTKPNDISARLMRADYRLRQNNTKAAKADIEYAYRSIPGGKENLDVIQSYTAILTAESDFKTAKDVLSAAKEKLPNEIRLQISLADVQIQMKDAEAAKKTLLDAYTTLTKLDRIMLDIADRLIDLGDKQTVNQIVTKFRTGEIKYAADYLDGRLKLREGQWPTAVTLLKDAVDGGLDRFPVYQLSGLVYLGDAYAAAGNVTERLRYLNRAFKIDSRSPRVQLGRAECFTQTGQKGQALEIYRQLALDSSEARAALCKVLLDQILTQPEAERNWRALEDAYGPAPRSIEIDIVRATALIQQNKYNDAIDLLEKTIARPEAAMLTAPRVALVYAKANRNLSEGFSVLDAAEQALGKQVDFLAARAVLLARTPNIDPAKIIQLGEQTGTLKPAERHLLFTKIGGLLVGLGQVKPAMEFYRRACAENAQDVTLRLNLFELAVQTDDKPLQDLLIQELDAVEGPNGVSRTIAEVSREIRTIKPGQLDAVDALKTKMKSVLRVRDSWAPAEIMMGDLELLAKQYDAALGHYRRAIALGDETQGVVRNVVRLLLERQGQAEALDLLNRLSRKAVLPADLSKQLLLLRSAYGNDPQQALGWARSTQAQDSKYPRDHLMRAAVLETNGVREEARKAVEKALSLDETLPESWVTLVRLLVQEGKLNEAKNLTQTMQQKLKPKPDDKDSAAAVLLAIGSCWDLLGEPTTADGYYKQSLQTQPTNPAVVSHVHRFYQRNGQSKEAMELLEGISTNPDVVPEVRRWSRRLMAFAKVSASPSDADWKSALEIIDKNLVEGNRDLEDQRARALILAVDPFRQAEAIDLLNDSAATTPLSPTEQYYLSRMYEQQGRFDKAEQALRQATRMGATAMPEHLASLAQLQVKRGNIPSAAETVNRLKSAAGNSWEVLCEEARILAAQGQTDEAARKLLGWKQASNGAFALKRVAPFLEEIQCISAAETVYLNAAKDTKAGAYLPLASFYLRNKRASEAVELAFKNEATSPIGLTARLLAGAVRVRPPALLSDADRTAWTPTVERIDAWITQRVPQNLTNAELLFAKAEMDDINGRYDEALTAYDQILKLDGENPIYLNNYAMLVALHLRDGGDKSRTPIEKIISKFGPRPTFLDTRAVVHTSGERFAEALRDLNAAIGIDPKPGYFFHKAIIEERTAGKDGPTSTRDSSFREATRRGLKKEMLHPKEWADFDRLQKEVR